MIFTITTVPTTIELPSWGSRKMGLLNEKATPVYMKMVLRIYLLVRAQKQKQITGDL